MLYRIGPAMLSLVMAGAVPRCAHIPYGDGDFDGDAGASAGGVAGTRSGKGGSGGSRSVGGGAGLGAGESGEAGMSSAGSAGVSGGVNGGGAAGTAGTGAGGGSGTGGASAGGAAGSGGGSMTGELLLSGTFLSSPFPTQSANMAFLGATCNGVAVPPQPFTLSNGTNVSIDWSSTLTEPFPFLSIVPSGSSLPPGASVTVMVTPLPLAPASIPPALLPNLSGAITISGDPSGLPLVVNVTEQVVLGIDISWSPVTLDFGMVPIGGPAGILTVTQESGGTSVELGSDNSHFATNRTGGFTPGTWSVLFSPSVLGVQTATLTWGALSSNSPFCTPHTFTATGTGIVVGSAGCAQPGIPFGTPCGTNQVCAFPGPCVTELTLAGSPVTFAPGSLFSGTVASGTVASAQSAVLTANIDWGDQTASAGSVVLPTQSILSLPFTVNGSHTYASSGSFQGTVTVTDQTTAFSAQTTFTASN
jgi:hypothetical protein